MAQSHNLFNTPPEALYERYSAVLACSAHIAPRRMSQHTLCVEEICGGGVEQL